MDWQAMVFLGAYHGINPGMGWLFAVALGLQQGSARGVWRALPPIVAGHALSVGVVLATAGLAQIIVPFEVLHALVAALLISMGLYRLWRHGHPRFGGMQVGFRDLTVWSFLMASAHGAGLMVVPVLMGVSAPAESSHHGAHSSGLLQEPRSGVLIAAGIHTLGYLLVTGAVAALVYEKLGLRLLGRAWFNLDLLWGVALILTGAATALL
jgi:hypothetical protein